MIQRLALIGASGHGKVIADVACAIGVETIIFYDDRWQGIRELCGYQVVGDVAKAIEEAATDYDAAVVSIGNSSIREALQQQLSCVASALIHPSASVSSSVKLGVGSVVMPNAVINADSVIGDGVIINSGAVIEHDCIVGDFSHICPNAALGGGVVVGQKSWIGIGSSIIQLTKVGSNVTVGAGSVVIRDVHDNQTVVGNPAKLIKR
ncbi:acetyltransferase [Pseudidiomarina sp. 1APR75-33.1]|uniref:acetyltransferase n=1 Tax=Pseudidiomarina terrestris TaxID=2820060 RepID=UPI00264C4121|nr:acetyltransferase [Pseudidiomarina sp. 1APR75-33.1]MDN7126934.1 acetyltransferase [Pseudidiomarina sp. 1APR75-33.1]